MQVGLCTISNKEASVESVIRTAADVGYDGVEIWGRQHVGDGSVETCRSIRDVASEQSIELPVYGSYLRAGSDGFDDELERELAIAERLGADLIRVWAGTQEYGDHDERHWRRTVDDLATVARRAAARDVGVTVEKHANTLTNDAEGARRLIEDVDSERCQLNWQPAFSLSPAVLLREARELVGITNHVHLQAVPQVGGSDRCPLSDAYFDVEALLGVFAESDYEGYVNVEFVARNRDYGAAVEADHEYLRSAGAGR